LFTFVISLVVVGAALFFASRIVTDAAPKPDKPATPVPDRAVGRHLGQDDDVRWLPTAEVGHVPVLRRIRSGFLLIVMLTVLGVLAALVLVIGGAVLLSALRSAVQ
jgi:hypothetical protein